MDDMALAQAFFFIVGPLRFKIYFLIINLLNNK